MKKANVSRLMMVFLMLVLPKLAMAKGETYEFVRPDLKQATAEERPKFENVGELLFNNGLSIPAYSLTLTSGFSESGWATTEAEDLTINESIQPELSATLAAYRQPHGWIVVPKEWRPIMGEWGANGSVSLMFAPNEKSESYLTYFDAGSSVGLVESAASVFFEKGRMAAQKNEFPYYTKTNVKLKMVALNSTQRSYSYQLDEGYKVNGLATYDDTEDERYTNVTVSLPSKDHALATELLNWYVIKKQK